MHFYNKQKTLTGKGNETDKLNMQNKWRETKDTEDEVNNNINWLCFGKSISQLDPSQICSWTCLGFENLKDEWRSSLQATEAATEGFL